MCYSYIGKPNKRSTSLRGRPQLPVAERAAIDLSSIDAYTPSVSDALHCVRVLDLFARNRAPSLLAQVRSLEASLGQLLDAAFPASSTSGSTSAATAAGESTVLALSCSAPTGSGGSNSASSRAVASSARASGSRARSRPARKTRLPRSLKARTASVTDDALAVEFDDSAAQGTPGAAADECAAATEPESQPPALDEEEGLDSSAAFVEGTSEEIDQASTTPQDEFDMNSE